MGEEDLQVSATWTEPKFRGKGLARVALAHIVRTMAAPGRRFWYVSRESNIASIRVCRHVGFEFSCYATRRTPFRLYSLGKVEEVPEPPRGEIEGWRPLGRETETAAWYARYYSRAGADRNDLRMNRGVMFQTIAFERSFISALYRLPLELPGISVLDVGCGAGTSWYQLFRLGINPHKTVGIDLQFDRLARIGRLYPQSTGIHADATCMPFANAVFDLVYESTLFATLSDDRVRADIAAEMVRVLRPNGYLLLVDWRTPQPWNRNYSALTRTEVRRLFGIDKTTSLVCVSQGALIPPVGRLLSTYAQSLYFLVAGLCPPLVGQVAYLLRKH
jgi:ubiquinone/menaquinone biosynthesis C-methylase UbiE